jgi:signal transduction histidine kinase
MADSFESVELRLSEGAEAATAELPELSREVVYGAVREAMRNAARHGRADVPGDLHVEVRVEDGPDLTIQVADDGVGFAAPGEGTRQGSGLELHATMMAVIGGSLQVESKPGGGTRAIISVPHAPGARGSS